MPLGTFTFKFQECNWKNLFHICELFKHLQKLFGLFVMTMIKFYPCQCKSKCSRHSGCCAGSSNWVFARFFEKHLNIRNICATLRFPALATQPSPLHSPVESFMSNSRNKCVCPDLYGEDIQWILCFIVADKRIHSRWYIFSKPTHNQRQLDSSVHFKIFVQFQPPPF